MRSDVAGVYAGYIDTDMAAHVTQPKTSPRQVVERSLAGLESGLERVLADDRSVQIEKELARIAPRSIQNSNGVGIRCRRIERYETWPPKPRHRALLQAIRSAAERRARTSGRDSERRVAELGAAAPGIVNQCLGLPRVATAWNARWLPAARGLAIQAHRAAPLRPFELADTDRRKHSLQAAAV